MEESKIQELYDKIDQEEIKVGEDENVGKVEGDYTASDIKHRGE